MNVPLGRRRTHRCRWLILAATLVATQAVVGCDDGSGPPPTPPEISNLQLVPGPAVHVDIEAPMKAVGGTLRFEDPNGDLESLDLTIRDGLGTVVSSERLPLTRTAGVVSGEISGFTQVDASMEASYEIEVYVVDASGFESNVLTTSFEIIEPPWRELAAPPRVLALHAVAELDGLIYVIGGNRIPPDTVLFEPVADVDVYDPATDTWSVGLPLPAARKDAVAAAADGRLFVIGGHSNTVGPPTDTVYAYDPEADEWTTGEPMTSPRSAMAAAVYDDAIYVAGGLGDSSFSLDTFEVYDPQLDAWTTLPALPVARHEATLTAASDTLSSIGGENLTFGFGSIYVEDVDVFDPLSGVWSVGAPMPWPTPPTRAGSAALDGGVHVMGGMNFSFVEEHRFYDPIADAWDRRMNLPEDLPDARAVELGGKIYVFGASQAWEYSPERELP